MLQSAGDSMAKVYTQKENDLQKIGDKDLF